MSVVGHQPPPFFKRGPAPLVRLIFFVALSLLLMVSDVRFQTLEWARQGFSLVMYPLQRLAYAPIEGVGQGSNYFTSLVTLERENIQLRQQQLGTATRLQRQDHLEQENQRLRALLDMKQRQPVVSQIGEILYAARDPFARRVILDKGTQDDVQPGQIVIDELGVIGQVTRAFPMLAEVTLITDKEQAVPVQIVRNGLRAVLFGAGAGSMELRFLAANADVKNDDILVTSGLDNVYLPGLPVARVKHVDNDTTYAFARIKCEPIAGVERHGQVLILGKHPVKDAQPADPEALGTPGKKKRGRK